MVYQQGLHHWGEEVMQIKYGLISCDSHAQPHKDAFTSRMSKAKWGEAIPHLMQTTDKAHMAVAMDHPVERWVINGQVVGNRGVVNCPTVMSDPMRKYFPQYWDEVPSYVYDPTDRLTALDNDGVDGEVLFPNDPVQSGTFFQGNAEFELDCVRAYNDAIAAWREVSDRYVPLAIIPYMSGIDVTVAEVQRAVKQAMGPSGGFSVQAQFIPNLIFSGVLDRYPRLKWVCAETGLGWVNYILEGCNHEWERRHLWTEGIVTRPSELFRRQIYVDFWYESAGIQQRHNIGIENIMWESDYPHSTSTYPESWQFVNRTLAGVPEDEKKQLLYGNAMRVYGL
jgi:predicted TIM-barrel fold metal-dependent hydrolase